MELRTCPLCNSKPLLLSVTEVVCLNNSCPAGGLIFDSHLWNRRAEVVSRDNQILKELKLEHAIENHMKQFQSGGHYYS